MPDVDYLPFVFAEMLAASRVMNGGFRLDVRAACSEYAPESVEVWLAVIHYGTASEEALWQIDRDNWREVVRQAKRMLAERHETGRSEPTPGFGVQGMF